MEITNELVITVKNYEEAVKVVEVIKETILSTNVPEEYDGEFETFIDGLTIDECGEISCGYYETLSSVNFEIMIPEIVKAIVKGIPSERFFGSGCYMDSYLCIDINFGYEPEDQKLIIEKVTHDAFDDPECECGEAFEQEITKEGVVRYICPECGKIITEEEFEKIAIKRDIQKFSVIDGFLFEE